MFGKRVTGSNKWTSFCASFRSFSDMLAVLICAQPKPKPKPKRWSHTREVRVCACERRGRTCTSWTASVAREYNSMLLFISTSVVNELSNG
jgi:hypothetical protein